MNFTLIDVILSIILIGLIVMSILLDSRNARHNRKSKEDVRDEIHSRINRSGKENRN